MYSPPSHRHHSEFFNTYPVNNLDNSNSTFLFYGSHPNYNGNLLTKRLNALYRVFADAYERYSCLLVKRFDLRLSLDPNNQSEHNHNVIITRFTRKLRYLWDKECSGKLGYAWCREKETSKGWHWHFMLIADQNHNSRSRIDTIIKESWSYALDSNVNPSGLVEFVKYWSSIGKGADKLKLAKAFYACTYLCKHRIGCLITKDCWGSSRVQNKESQLPLISPSEALGVLIECVNESSKRKTQSSIIHLPGKIPYTIGSSERATNQANRLSQVIKQIGSNEGRYYWYSDDT